MQITGNTILITGGGTGIGLGLAKAFHELGNKVIISGRRRSVLDELAKQYHGMGTYAFDVQRPEEIKKFSEWLRSNHPDLNVLINNAGIQREENFQEIKNTDDMEAIVATNLLGPLRMTAALLPGLLGQPHATVMNVSSGLGFVPMANTPTYCATKAAIHSYTQSLRYQLKKTKVQVIEIIPPYVATDLMGGAKDPMAMPLDEFIEETMGIIKSQPYASEICVERVKPFRHAAESINFENFYYRLNSSGGKRVPR
jgi:uncharacterized oxidoreductase